MNLLKQSSFQQDWSYDDCGQGHLLHITTSDLLLVWSATELGTMRITSTVKLPRAYGVAAKVASLIDLQTPTPQKCTHVIDVLCPSDAGFAFTVRQFILSIINDHRTKFCSWPPR